MATLARAAKAILFVMAPGTVSMTLLALPAARVVAAALPVSAGRPLSHSSLREIVRQSHAQFGEIAAEVACTYLKKFGYAQGSTLPAQSQP